MFQILFIAISYGALLLLLMPATGVGVIATAVLFAFGLGLLVFHFKKVFDSKNRNKFLAFATVLIVANSGRIFYIRWLHSSKIQAIASVLHVPVEVMLFIGALTLSVLSAYFVYAGLGMLAKKLFYRMEQHSGFVAVVNKLSGIDWSNNLFLNLVYCLIAAVITVILAQGMLGLGYLSMGRTNFRWGILIVLAVILFLYSLFGRALPAVFIGSGLWMVLATINVYVYSFRGRLLEPVDIFSAGTAINVAKNYSLFPIPPEIRSCWRIFAAMLVVLWLLSSTGIKLRLTLKKRLALLAICAVSSVSIFFYASGLQTHHWYNEDAIYNGYILGFVSKFKELSASKPDHYSTELIAELADEYTTESDKNAPGSELREQPHIIVIMNEAFSDLSVVGEFSTNTQVMPFFSSLKENTVSGYTLTSVYGGNTANSEYEFLTGNSLAWLSPNIVPYQQYVRPSTYSMVSYLKLQYNYKCIAMHPFYSSGWNRPAAYAHLGFDECYFIEDFSQRDYVREFISDQEMFEFLIETYEAQKDEPLFLFGVTMQNHGGYTYSGENWTQTISLNDYEVFPEVEQYLSLIRKTDEAVEYLITYFQNVDEDVIIVFFGDHQPKLDAEFYAAVSGTTADTLDEQQKRYQVPFFIWTNYDIEEKYIECTSLNYLSSYVYEAAGIALPPYNRFLRELEVVVPAINANGFYSLEEKGYLTVEQANEDELYWLQLYEMLQYNNIFDKKQKNEVMFPALN